MKCDVEIREQIKMIVDFNSPILNREALSFSENSTISTLQLFSIAKLQALYWVLGEQMPAFKCQKPKKA